MRVLESGIPVHSNQVQVRISTLKYVAPLTQQFQFSLIDSRPTVAMGDLCSKHNVKLLTYGTLCGGFLADEWLDKPEPEMYDDSSTPSKRKAGLDSSCTDPYQTLILTHDSIMR